MLPLRPTLSQTLPIFAVPELLPYAATSEHADVCPFLRAPIRDRSSSFKVNGTWPEGTQPQWYDKMVRTVEDAVAVPPLPNQQLDSLRADLHALGCDSVPYAKLRHLGAQLHLHVETIKLLIAQQSEHLLAHHPDTLTKALADLKTADELAHLMRRNAEHLSLDRSTADRIETMLPELQKLNGDIALLLRDKN